MVVVVVSRIVSQVVLDAGAGGPGVTAAKRDTIHQVFSLHVTEDTTVGQRQRSLLAGCHKHGWITWVWHKDLGVRGTIQFKPSMFVLI